MHMDMKIEPPCSPISPTPPEVEVPSVDERLQGYMNSEYFDQNLGASLFGDPSQAPSQNWDEDSLLGGSNGNE